MTDAGGESPCRGLVWFKVFAWWSIAYSVSMRGTWTLEFVANLIGEPRNVSISMGRRAWKSWYIMLGASDAVIFSSVFCWKSLGKEQPVTLASSRSSSMTPITN